MAGEAERVEAADSEQDDEVEDQYEVERIIDMRVEEGEVLYRVRWKNYCSDDDTWEPEAHLEDCREVLVAFKKKTQEAKAKKDAESKKTMKLPTKSDVFDANSGSDSEQDQPTEMLSKKKKKKKKQEEERRSQKEKEKKKKKKDKQKEDLIKPVPAPSTDDEDEERAATPPTTPKEGRKTELKKRLVDSDEEEQETVPPKKHRKDKGKDGSKHKKDKEEGKKRGKKERRVDSSEDEATAPEAQTDDSAAKETSTKTADKSRSDDKSKEKKVKVELKLQGIKDLIRDKKSGKSDTLAKLKTLTLATKVREDTTPSSDSSDSSTLNKKAKSKGQDSASVAPAKVPSSSASSSSSSSSTAVASISKARDEEVAKEEAAGQKDAAASNLFEKFLLGCEAKDRAPRKHSVHQPTSTDSSKSNKLLGKIEKKAKSTKDLPGQKAEEKTEKTKQSDASKPGHSHGFNLDSDEKEGEEFTPRSRFAEDPRDRRERLDEPQRSSWDRRTPTSDDKRRKREDSEPRLFIACDDNLDPTDPLEGDKSDKGQATLSLGMDLNLDWMTLEDFQKHLNGDDEILSGPPLSPSELRDAVKSGDYMSVKLALNSKEDYNLDQEACAVDERRSVEGEKSLIEERSSSDVFRLNVNTDSSQEEVGTGRAIDHIQQHFDHPVDQANVPGGLASPNTEQLMLREDVNNLGYGNSESNATKLNSYQDGLGDETRIPIETNIGLSSELNLDFEHVSLSNDAGMTDDGDKTPVSAEEILDTEHKPATENQSCAGEGNGSSDEAQDMAESDTNEADHVPLADNGTTDDPAAESSKEIAKTQSRRKKTWERTQPTRSSSRTSKKVLVTPPGTEDDEEEVSSKKHFCVYCKMAFSQLVRHLERKHSDETDVAHAIHFPKGSKIRQTLLDQIRNKGNYEHNYEALKSGEGENMAKTQTSDATISVRDYLPCQHCFTFYRKTELWKHECSCKAKRGEQKPAEGMGRPTVQSAASRFDPTSEFFTGGCDDIIDIMHQDDISRHVRNDPLICKYGKALSAKHDHVKSQYTYIAQKMRELGRFVLAVNELDSSVQYLHEICVPSKFDLAVEGAKKASGFDPSSSRFKTISLVSKIGYSLKRAAEIAFGESRMTEDCETEGQVKRFIQLLDTEWNDRFSRRALGSAFRRQEVKKEEMDISTLAEDVIKLHKFVQKEEDKATKELKESPNPSTWRKLSEATLSEVCLFNRGRIGNIGRMILETYTSCKSKRTFVPSADQIMKSTKLELELSESFMKLELEGQFGRNTLVLLTQRMVVLIDLLVENREQAGVAKDNPYVFARNEGSSYIRGLDCCRRAANECHTKNPEALLSPTVREQVASYWQLLSLSERELDQVAKLVELDIQECPQLSENATQLEEMSKRLLKMDRTVISDTPTKTNDGPTPKNVKKRPWSEAEQFAVKRCLGDFISIMKVPGKKECNTCISAEPVLHGRSWTDVKSYVHNMLQSIKKRQRKSDEEAVFLEPKRPKEGNPAVKKESPDKSVVDGTTSHLVQPNDCIESLRVNRLATTVNPLATTVNPLPMTANPLASTFSQQITSMMSGYSPMGVSSANMAHTSRSMVPTFTPLNAANASMVPTYPQHSRHAPMASLYALQSNRSAPTHSGYSLQNSRTPPMSPAYSPHNSRSPTMSPPYIQQDTSNAPLVPTFTPLNAPSPPIVPNYSRLNDRSRSMMSSFTPLNHPSTSMVSSFTPLNHSSTPPYPSSSPRALPGTQVMPPTHPPPPMVPDKPPVAQTNTPMLPPAKKQDDSVKTPQDSSATTQKRTKRLWSEPEQAAVRRQLGDLCKLVKAPGKKECDACLAAEPALSSRSWREVKYYVHNTIQSIRKRGVTPKRAAGRDQQDGQSSSMEWDAPVYLSL